MQTSVLLMIMHWHPNTRKSDDTHFVFQNAPADSKPKIEQEGVCVMGNCWNRFEVKSEGPPCKGQGHKPRNAEMGHEY